MRKQQPQKKRIDKFNANLIRYYSDMVSRDTSIRSTTILLAVAEKGLTRISLHWADYQRPSIGLSPVNRSILSAGMYQLCQSVVRK